MCLRYGQVIRTDRLAGTVASATYQLDAVVMERPFARAFKGKISPVTTQAQGPLVVECVSNGVNCN